MLVQQQQADPDLSVDVLCTSVDGTKPRKTFSFVRAMILLTLRGLRRPAMVLHVHTSAGASFRRKAIVMRVGALLGLPSVLHFHASKFDTMFEGSPSHMRWVRRQLDRAKIIVVLANSWVDRLKSLTDTPVRWVPNGIDLRSDLSAREYSDAERPLILFIGGTVLRRKGAFELLAAVDRLSNREPACPTRLVVAGLGELEEARRIVSSRSLSDVVDLAGWVDDARKSQLLAQADIFVLPSFAEGLPIGLLEAMAAGLPTIATPVGGIPDLIRDGENGILVPVGDVDGLARAIRSLAGDPALRRRLGTRGQASVRDGFDIALISRKLKGLYQAVAPD